MSSLQMVVPGSGGIRRRRSGSGFSYRDADGRAIRDEATVERISSLVIPPAWQRVWIADSASAHIQATGVDAAGRTQYLYHDQWREEQDAVKFDRALELADRLTGLRRTITLDLEGRRGAKVQALAAAVRLIDRAGLRVGGADYAEQNGSFGVTTLERRHVLVDHHTVSLDFTGKSGAHWEIELRDPALARFFSGVPLRPRRSPALSFAVREGRRKTWRGIDPESVNDYLRSTSNGDFTAKDIRTWRGTVFAACALAKAVRTGNEPERAIRTAIEEAAAWLHNTPTVARDSYIDPRVVEAFERGAVADLRRSPDRAVAALLRSQ